MRLLSRKISAKDSSGSLKLSPQISTDIYHLHNLIHPSDLLSMSTHRKVKTSSGNGTVRTEKKRIHLTIKVTSKIYDHTDDSLRISGLNSTESSSVRLGASHTFTIVLNDTLTLEKERWDEVDLMRLKEMSDLVRSSELIAIVLQEDGKGNVCVVNEHLTIVKSRVDVTIPKKRADKAWGGKKNTSQTSKFYMKLYEGMLDFVDFENVKAILIGGPGFCPNDFYAFMVEQAQKDDNKILTSNLHRFVLCRASSGHKHAVDEMLSGEGVRGKIEDVKVFKDVECLEGFFRLIDTDEERAYYGLKEVQRAADHGAVSELLVSDDVFRTEESTRRIYVELVEAVKESGGSIRVFSSMHESGRRLAQVSGVAAVLRFPIGDGEGEDMEVDQLEEEHEDDWYFSRGADVYGVGEELGGEEEEDEEEEEEEDDRAGDFFKNAKTANERIEEDMQDMGF